MTYSLFQNYLKGGTSASLSISAVSDFAIPASTIQGAWIIVFREDSALGPGSINVTFPSIAEGRMFCIQNETTLDLDFGSTSVLANENRLVWIFESSVRGVSISTPPVDLTLLTPKLPVDDDLFLLGDSAAGFANASATGTNLKMFLATSGDLNGSLDGSQTVIGIQGRPLSSSAPATNDSIIWDGSEWIPSPLTFSISTLTATTPALNDLVPFYDVSALGNRHSTLENVFNTFLTGDVIWNGTSHESNVQALTGSGGQVDVKADLLKTTRTSWEIGFDAATRLTGLGSGLTISTNGSTDDHGGDLTLTTEDAGNIVIAPGYSGTMSGGTVSIQPGAGLTNGRVEIGTGATENTNFFEDQINLMSDATTPALVDGLLHVTLPKSGGFVSPSTFEGAWLGSSSTNGAFEFGSKDAKVSGFATHHTEGSCILDGISNAATIFVDVAKHKTGSNTSIELAIDETTTNKVFVHTAYLRSDGTTNGTHVIGPSGNIISVLSVIVSSGNVRVTFQSSSATPQTCFVHFRVHTTVSI